MSTQLSSLLTLNSNNMFSINSKTYDIINEFLDYRENIYKNAILYLDKYIFTGDIDIHQEIVFYMLLRITFSSRFNQGDIKYKLSYLYNKSKFRNIKSCTQELIIEEIMKTNSTYISTENENPNDILLFELLFTYNFSLDADTLFKYPKYFSTLGFYFLSNKIKAFISNTDLIATTEEKLKLEQDNKLYDSEETEVVNVADDEDSEYSLSLANDYEVDMELTMYEYEMFTRLENKLNSQFYKDTVDNTMDHKSYLTYVLKDKNGVERLKEYLTTELTEKEEYKVKNYQNWLLR